MGEHIQTNEVTCPYCDLEFSDSWKMSDEDDYECGCGKTFSYAREVSVTYTSYRNCELNNDEHDRVELKHMDKCSKCDVYLDKNPHASQRSAPE